jgi:peptidyl-prolyl cis-trans isomerase C
MNMSMSMLCLILLLVLCNVQCFSPAISLASPSVASRLASVSTPFVVSSSSRVDRTQVNMNIFEDAYRFFTNLKKEASAKHILMTGSGASDKLRLLKTELETATDLNTAFSELASKVSECPSASRGGNLGTFKPGMMVKEFDQVCFEKELGVVHGPIETQFGSHLILITRRYEGDEKK